VADDIAPEQSGDSLPGWRPALWTLPRAAAVDNLTAALLRQGLTESAARALSRSAVRPDDMRRRLADPAELRVQGGTLLIAETRLWSAFVLPHPANPREYGHRHYPLGRSAAVGRMMAEPGSAPSAPAELELHVDTPAVICQRLDNAKARLVRDNPLAEDIAVEGVLQPLTVVPLTVRHRDGHPPATLLVAADGSSRVSAVHDLLGQTPSRNAYAYDERTARGEIGRWLRLVRSQGWQGLSEAERRGVRALTVPARVVVGFRANDHEQQAFHTAVRNFIGLTHIRPPRPYGPAVENEAKADAVLDSLAEPTRGGHTHLPEAEKHWFAGTITEEEARSKGLSGHRDVRAAEIVRALLGGGLGTARRVNDGIRSLTAKQRPKREERVDIAVELILRPVRTERDDDAKFVRPRRAVLQRAYRLPEIEDLPGDVPLEGAGGSPRTLEGLRDAALEEVGQGLGDCGRLGPAQTELAVKAAYHMAMAEPMALQREVFGGSDEEDDRGAATVLRAMLSRRRGVLQAYEVVRAARLNDRLREVDENGRPTRTAEGEVRELTDALVRHTYSGVPVPLEKALTGFRAAAEHWAAVTGSAEALRRSVTAMAAVPMEEGGPSLVGRDGWEPSEVGALRQALDRIDRTVAGWADRFDDRKRSAES
jgi:hypothetical protein